MVIGRITQVFQILLQMYMLYDTMFKRKTEYTIYNQSYVINGRGSQNDLDYSEIIF